MSENNRYFLFFSCLFLKEKLHQITKILNNKYNFESFSFYLFDIDCQLRILLTYNKF